MFTINRLQDMGNVHACKEEMQLFDYRILILNRLK